MPRVAVAIFVLAIFSSILGPAVGHGVPFHTPSKTGLFSDFNGDGFADLAVGVPNESVKEVSSAGAVNVLYGSAGGLQALSPRNQLWSQDSPGVEDSAEGGD